MSWLEIPPVPEALRGLPGRRVGKMQMQTDTERAAKRAAARVDRPVSCYGQRYESLRDAARLTKHAPSTIRAWVDRCKHGWGWAE